jgi:hypothetical protein
MEFIRGHAGTVLATHLFDGFILSFQKPQSWVRVP